MKGFKKNTVPVPDFETSLVFHANNISARGYVIQIKLLLSGYSLAPYQRHIKVIKRKCHTLY